jgi:sialidase-1
MKSSVTLFLLLCLISGCNQKTPSGNNGKTKKISVDFIKRPVLTGKTDNAMIHINVADDSNMKNQISVKEVEIFFKDKTGPANLSAIRVFLSNDGSGSHENILFGQSNKPGKKNIIRGDALLKAGNISFMVSFVALSNPDLNAKLNISRLRIRYSDKSVSEVPLTDDSDPIRFGIVLRAAGQDGCNTYRIPGIITTNSGTLIAVYDNRYAGSKDLQGDIDIGMSRSIDGGSSWEPMKVIMDMGEYGGYPQELNGTGDPCILYDEKTNTILVAALWLSGSSTDQMVWWASKPGMEPDVTGQFLIVKSTDDGLTWSQPVSITSQIKDPAWQLLLQGPGRGLTMKDGTLVFPAQFKADIGEKAIDGGQFTCHSTITWSRDGGNTWHIGTGAKSNTTESQVAELSDGTIMINMRDDRNRKEKGPGNGRAVATTTDLGTTWTIHPSSNSALPEPNCMASLISADMLVAGVKKHVLFFSNPANKNSRTKLTLKASLDEGITWPEDYQLELYAPECYGYSCLTMVDEHTIGILYEGIRELYFQKIPVNDILKEL